jgi:hypothetical protein
MINAIQQKLISEQNMLSQNDGRSKFEYSFIFTPVQNMNGL